LAIASLPLDRIHKNILKQIAGGMFDQVLAIAYEGQFIV